MARRKQTLRQRDFSGGEVRPDAKRRDDAPLVRAAARQMSNKRILASGALAQRPGRTLLFQEEGRTEEIKIATGTVFRFSFGAGTLVIRDANGIAALSATGLPWSTITARQIVLDVFGSEVFICFPGMRPRVATWAGGTTWSLTTYTARTNASGGKLVPFHRISPKGVTMDPSAATGSITITFSAAVLVAGHVGTRMRYAGRQLTIDTVAVDGLSGTATVNEKLLGSQRLAFTIAVDTLWTAGDVIAQPRIGARAEIASFPAANQADVVLLTPAQFSFDGTGSSDNTIFGPTGAAVQSGVPTVIAPLPSTVWDEEAMNDFRGWPASVTNDQSRLAFCDFPAVPRGIAWSGIDDPYNFLPGADPTDAMFELAPGKARVLYVVPGDDQFVFTDQGVFYIPISESNPLKPGSVAFRPITRDAAAPVKPVSSTHGVLFCDAGLTRVIAIVSTGQTAKPYLPRAISEYHSHLIRSPVALAVATADTQFPESYVYVLNADGSVAVGKFEPDKEWVGFVPWTPGGAGTFRWVSALPGQPPVFSSQYAAITWDRTDITFDDTARLWDAGLRQFVERLDTSAYLDAHCPLAGLPIAFPPPAGQGPLWFLRGTTVAVMVGDKPMGDRAVDPKGNLILQEGDEFPASTTLGFKWEEVVEPFLPHVEAGGSQKQSMRRRKIGKIGVTTIGRTGYVCAGRRITPWRQGDNQDEAPPMREETQFFKKLGRSVDPRDHAITKDVPGPLQIVEFGADVTV